MGGGPGPRILGPSVPCSLGAAPRLCGPISSYSIRLRSLGTGGLRAGVASVPGLQVESPAGGSSVQAFTE